MEDCVFCRVVEGQEAASVVYSDGAVVAFMDIQPIVPGHVLVVPRRHSVGLADTEPGDASLTFSVARLVAGAVRRSGIRCEGVNLLVMDGEAAFQDVPHFHVHVLPRYSGDGFSLAFPPTYGAPVERAELDAGAARIRSALA